MKITIDTKEDSVHEIEHTINLLQQILRTQGQTNRPSCQSSPYSSPSYSSPAPQPSAPSSPLAMFDSAPSSSAPPAQSAAPITPFSMFDAPSTPASTSSPPSAYPPPAPVSMGSPTPAASEAPSIFDIFGNDNTTSTPSQTTQETADDLLRYDKEQERKASSDYTFTTY